VPALTGAVVIFLFSAAPAAAGDSKITETMKDPVARSMVDAAEYLCRKECAREHKRPRTAREKENPEFLACLKKCAVENSGEITGTYALNGSRVSGDCRDFGPAITDPGVAIEEADGTITFFSSAEMTAPLGDDWSFRGEGTCQNCDGTFREIIEGVFVKDTTGRIIFLGTRTFEDLADGCTVSYRVTYTRQREK
jgi:hypothetical protein